MSRIAPTFERLKSQGRKALIPYVTAGFPFADITPELMHGMVDAGADVIELGVPFSDPMADGPVIQKAGEKALALGVGMRQVLAMVRRFRDGDDATPVVLMGYANPVERYDLTNGKDAFIRDAAAAGVDGILVVDYPPEECEEFAAKLKAHGLDLIFLLAPTSTDERMQAGRAAWRAATCTTCRSRASRERATSTRRRSGRCSPASGGTCRSRSAWASASATQPRPRPSARWPTRW